MYGVMAVVCIAVMVASGPAPGVKDPVPSPAPSFQTVSGPVAGRWVPPQPTAYTLLAG